MNWTSKMRVFFPPISLEIDSATTLAHFWRLHFLHQWPLWGPGCWFGSTGLGWAKELVVWLSPHFRWSHLVENTGQTSVQQTWISFQMDQIAIRMVLMFRKASSVPKLRKMKKRAPNMLLVTLYPYPNYSSFLLHPFLAVCIILYIYIGSSSVPVFHDFLIICLCYITSFDGYKPKTTSTFCTWFEYHFKSNFGPAGSTFQFVGFYIFLQTFCWHPLGFDWTHTHKPPIPTDFIIIMFD